MSAPFDPVAIAAIVQHACDASYWAARAQWAMGSQRHLIERCAAECLHAALACAQLIGPESRETTAARLTAQLDALGYTVTLTDRDL